MRKALVAAVSLVTSLATLFAAAAGPAAAEPARASSASAYGLSASGLLQISPTITTSAAFPPGGDNNNTGSFGGISPTLLTVPLGTLALAGTVGVTANAHQADDITPELATVGTVPCGGTNCSEPVTVGPVNTRGLAKTEGAAVLFEAPAEGEVDPVATLMQSLGSLLSADAITAEAVAKCVNGQPSFDVGFQILGLGGLVGTGLQGLTDAVLDLAVGLLGEDALLSEIITIRPGVVTMLPDGVAIDGLQVSLPLLNQNIVISHAEAHMPTNCGVAVAGPPTGPGPVADLGSLAATGSDVPFLPLGMGLMGAAVVTGVVVRRSRRGTAVQ